MRLFSAGARRAWGAKSPGGLLSAPFPSSEAPLPLPTGRPGGLWIGWLPSGAGDESVEVHACPFISGTAWLWKRALMQRNATNRWLGRGGARGTSLKAT